MKNLIIDNLKLKTLQRLAFHCGLPKTGKKGLLAEGLQNAVREHEVVRSGSRVLSIDMGVRNFAFSLMTPVKSSNSGPLVTLHHWQKVNLLENDNIETHSPNSHPDNVITAPDFSPAIMAGRALQLVNDHLLPLQPTHILIERQRWRTGGRAPVQEWTIRVNTLEAMLYGILATLKSQGQWHGKLVPIPPSRVVNYVVGADGVGPALFSSRSKLPLLLASKAELEEARILDGFSSASLRSTRKGNRIGTLEGGDKENPEGEGKGKVLARAKADESKMEKIRLLEKAFARGNAIGIGSPEVDSLRRQFVGGADDGQPAEMAKVARLAKRDDLSDCLFQGVAWLEWQRNIAMLGKTDDWSLFEYDV